MNLDEDEAGQVERQLALHGHLALVLDIAVCGHDFGVRHQLREMLHALDEPAVFRGKGTTDESADGRLRNG